MRRSQTRVESCSCVQYWKTHTAEFVSLFDKVNFRNSAPQVLNFRNVVIVNVLDFRNIEFRTCGVLVFRILKTIEILYSSDVEILKR